MRRLILLSWVVLIDAKADDEVCATACDRMLVYESASFCCPGLGAQVSNALVASAVALASGREFVWHSAVSSFGCPNGTSPPGSGGMDSIDCVFAPSRCQAAAVEALATKRVKDCATVDEGGDCAALVSREATPIERAQIFELDDAVVYASQFTTGTAFFQSLWHHNEHYENRDVCAQGAGGLARERLCRTLGFGTSDAPVSWLSVFRRIARRVVRLLPAAETTVQQLVASTSLLPPYTALHMRHGDKPGTNNFKPTPLARLLDLAEPAAHRSVFIATDDQAAVRKQISQLSERVHMPTIHFLDPSGVETGGHFEASFNALPSAERYREHLHVLAELRILASSAVFVSNFRSKFALLAETLRAESSNPALQVEPYVWVPGA